MKKTIALLMMTFARLRILACPACESQQPKILRGITHGAGPSGKWDYLIVCVFIVIVLFTLFYSVKWLIRPGEKAQQHIKRLILNPE
ncbi:MAG: hypothetical protein Q8918_11840 [Bacteroidota bacterium]|nr:hypothetical protein [Bacteroidota bacterium]MDP4212969.1 hypothetical protein [Bacteroidota bacterium]MDP4250791.1 hypothetical protein [Bacteroidota bacterium]